MERPEEWRRFDCDLFDGLLRIDRENTRDVAALEPFLPDALFERRYVPCGALPYSHRPIERHNWLLDVRRRFEDRDLIFLDPDNGIAPKSLKPTQRRAGKSVFISGIKELKDSHRAIVIYHHHSMFKGGHEAELRSIAGRLKADGFRVCGALRAKPWSPRAFFILDGDEELCSRALDIERRWDGWIKWYSGVSLGLSG
jgi:hypothetical protein